MTVSIGQQVPDIELLASNGEKVKLSDFRGKHVVLYFYPKDMTPGCTTEACAFRDFHEDFTNVNAVILGVSADPLEKHQKFINKHALPFLLLVDDEHKLCEQFGVWKEKNIFGKIGFGIERSTFIIDKEGTLVKEWRKVKVQGHVEEALQYIKEHLS